jgi:hypothetical protein
MLILPVQMKYPQARQMSEVEMMDPGSQSARANGL